MAQIIKLIIQLIIAILVYYLGNSEGYHRGCREEAEQQERRFQRLRQEQVQPEPPAATPTPTSRKRILPLGEEGATAPIWTPLDDKYVVPDGDRLVRVYPAPQPTLAPPLKPSQPSRKRWFPRLFR